MKTDRSIQIDVAISGLMIAALLGACHCSCWSLLTGCPIPITPLVQELFQQPNTLPSVLLTPELAQDQVIGPVSVSKAFW